MSVRTVAMYDDHELGSVANQIKELTVNVLKEQGTIDPVAADLFLEQHAIIVVKKGWLGTTIDQILNLKTADDKVFQVVRVVR